MGKMCDVAVGHRWCVCVLSVLVLSVMGTSLGVAQVQDPPSGEMQQRDAQIGEDKDRATTEQERLLVSSSNEESTLDEAKLEQTDEVVVSATKTRQPVSHVTSAVEVITGEQMQRRNLKTVAEALRLATGMVVLSSGAQGTLTNVKMRGSTTEQVLVLIDGAIVNSATAGGYDLVPDNRQHRTSRNSSGQSKHVMGIGRDRWCHQYHD